MRTCAAEADVAILGGVFLYVQVDFSDAAE